MASQQRDYKASTLSFHQEEEEQPSGRDSPKCSLCPCLTYKDKDTGPSSGFYARSMVLGWLCCSCLSLEALHSNTTERCMPRGEPPKIRCMLHMWSVILYLRLPWITAQAGIGLTWLIILLSASVTAITGMSISAISTNSKVKAGSKSFLISRSLGPELGGSIGIIFAFASSVAVAMHTVGFAETLLDLLRDHKVQLLNIDPENELQVVGMVIVTILLGVALASVEWESKAQIIFFFLILLSFINYLLGTLLPTNPSRQATGFFGYQGSILLENMVPQWCGPEGSFFGMFSIFFSSATGLLTGTNISEDLKDPATAIPKGTLLAIMWTTLSYLGISATIGSCMIRDASGNMTDMGVWNGSCLRPECQYGWDFSSCRERGSCLYGLSNHYQAMSMVSAFSPLTSAGVFCAALSSALSCFVSAPKVFQWLCQDKLYPVIGFFGKGYGKKHEPLRGYLFTFLIAVGFILTGDLNTIAAIISNFYLCSYALVNFGCFHAFLSQSPGWRPSFCWYSPWLSLLGSLLCLLIMFLLNWWAALIAVLLILLLLFYAFHKKPDVNRGSSVQEPQAIQESENHVNWLNVRKIRSFYTVISAPRLRSGAQSLMQVAGLGQLKPNLLVLGYKQNWQEVQISAVEDYVGILHDALDYNYGVCILRMPGGLSPATQHQAQVSLHRQPQTLFQSRQGWRTVDVYWLSDDGGLTMLIPYLLTHTQKWARCPVRVFVSSPREQLEDKHKEIHSLLRRFSLGFQHVTVLPELTGKPQETSQKAFEDLVALHWLQKPPPKGNLESTSLNTPAPSGYISEQDLQANQKQSEWHMCLHEVLRQYSQDAALIVMSLPLIPRSACPGALYMTWLEMLSRGLTSPIAFIHGKQQDLLTTYCQ
ncbi:solute carrier family 12 member 3-like isoform X1 [Equus asinus]|uniref:solute carrier family 12 member 3-like isoform X1 n=1 Tax=Equus asinus TaxID=9793 RepID=UPI0038F68D00